jgi:predicted kinase
VSGLPAAGKDTWIEAHARGAQVIALDGLRGELGISPTDDQGPVIAAAKAKARLLLAAGAPLIWNATNINRSIRKPLTDLFAAYGAKITVVYVETGEGSMKSRNAVRADPVPAPAIARMLARWEPPDLTECHDVIVELT